MGKNRTKWERRKRAKITDDNVPELRVKTPTLENYIYVAALAQQGRRSLPQQIELIFEEHKKFKQQE